MFGMLAGPGGDGDYRRVYRGLCRAQRRHYGTSAGVFLCYETVFLYLLGIDAGRLPEPLHAVRRYEPDPEAAAYCASLGMLLAQVKMDDDIRDEGLWRARCVRWFYRAQTARAEQWFDQRTPGLRPRVTEHLHRHLANECAGRPIPIEDYVEPTVAAFGLVFGEFARRVGAPVDLFTELGGHVAVNVIAFDCALDWEHDRKHGTYNPLPDEAARGAACAFTEQRLRTAAEICEQQLRGNIAALVLRHNLDRVRDFASRVPPDGPAPPA